MDFVARRDSKLSPNTETIETHLREAKEYQTDWRGLD